MKALTGPPRRHPSEVWSGLGRYCVWNDEVWELRDVYANPDDPNNWRFVERLSPWSPWPIVCVVIALVIITVVVAVLL